jgi:K+-sensing histidine kinase KdpD
VAVITDARFSGVSTGACIGHVSPEALAGGPVGKVKEGDLIEIIIDRVKLEATVDLIGENGEVFGAKDGARRLDKRAPRTDLAHDPQLPDDTKLWAALIQQGGGVWGGCVYDLDAITKLESGEQPLYKQNFVIQDLVKEVFESLSIKAEQKNIRYGIKKGCESPLSVFADKEKIRQVILNLVENSIKYGKYGGTITASMYITDERHVLVEISDDGIGMAERHLSRIFERFYRTEEGRSLDITGSGLGLAICKHIIEAHGQTIHARSTEHVGTTIGFTLERKKE